MTHFGVELSSDFSSQPLRALLDLQESSRFPLYVRLIFGARVFFDAVFRTGGDSRAFSCSFLAPRFWRSYEGCKGIFVRFSRLLHAFVESWIERLVGWFDGNGNC
jgi:hypothetical protein